MDAIINNGDIIIFNIINSILLIIFILFKGYNSICKVYKCCCKNTRYYSNRR